MKLIAYVRQKVRQSDTLNAHKVQQLRDGAVRLVWNYTAAPTISLEEWAVIVNQELAPNAKVIRMQNKVGAFVSQYQVEVI